MQIEKSLKAFQIITDYLITGVAPEGIRPAFLEAAATIIRLAADYNEIKAAPMLPRSFEYRVRDHNGQIILQTNDFNAAADLLDHNVNKHNFRLDHATVVMWRK